MTHSDLHSRAERLSRELGCTHSDALAILGTRGAEAKKRRRLYGVLHPTRADRAAFDAVEPPRYAWQNRADLQ